MAPKDLQPELQRMEKILEVWRQAIGLLAQKAPKQLNLTDFKGQTPLMLVAEVADSELVRSFLDAGADPNKQDFEGRSALHAAVKSHDNATVDALLNHPCSSVLKTVDGRTPLHTAAWSGNDYGVKQILTLAPQLAWQQDSNGMTALELAEALLDQPEALSLLNNEMSRQHRPHICPANLESVIYNLAGASAIN